MKKPSFYYGIALAFLFSFFGSALFATLTPIYPDQWVLRVVITLLALAYLLYLLSASPACSGKITVLVLWLLVIGFSWFLLPSLPIYTLLHIGMIWLVRSIYYYRSVLSAIADMGLNALGLIAASWALVSTGSLFLSFWCFFLIQALFIAIPATWKHSAAKETQAEDESFQRAYRSAESALRRLTNT